LSMSRRDRRYVTHDDLDPDVALALAEAGRDRSLRHKYGITAKDYDEFYASHLMGRCAICLRRQSQLTLADKAERCRAAMEYLS